MINERTGIVTFKGNPFTLQGTEIKVGDKAENFNVVDENLQPVKLTDFEGKNIVITTSPSIDTPVCDLQVKRFNKMVTEISDDVVVLYISTDLPFAMKRWCGATNSENIKALSDYQYKEFGLKYGLILKELQLMARATMIIDKEKTIKYLEIVPEQTDEPNYDKTLEEIKKLS